MNWGRRFRGCGGFTGSDRLSALAGGWRWEIRHSCIFTNELRASSVRTLFFAPAPIGLPLNFG